MKTFAVTHEYRGKVTVNVEAETPEDAENDPNGIADADAFIAGDLTIYNSTAREIPE